MVWDLAKNILEKKAGRKAVADRCYVWYLGFTGDNFSIQSVFGIIRNIQTERRVTGTNRDTGYRSVTVPICPAPLHTYTER
jgi:hypothetical protein